MTRSHRAPSRKDRNHDEIARALAKVAVVIDTHAAQEVGADLLVLSRGRVYFVEVKDGDKPASKRKLTPTEAKRRAECGAAGVPYVIARDIDEVWCAMDIRYCERSFYGTTVCECGTLTGPARFRGDR